MTIAERMTIGRIMNRLRERGWPWADIADIWDMYAAWAWSVAQYARRPV